MKCGKCGAEVPTSTYVCPKCGKKYTPGKYCPYCNAVIPATATICRKCGRPQPSAQQHHAPIAQQASSTNAFSPQKKKLRWYQIVLIILGVFFGIGVIQGLFSSGNSTPRKSSSSSSSSKSESQPQATSKPTPNSNQAGKSVKNKEAYIHSDFDTSEYTFISSELLYEYGQYFSGEKVGTVITVESKDNSLLKANTSNNDSLFFSINCEFEEDGLTSSFSEGDTVTVVGTVDEKALIGSTTTLKNCTIVGLGEISDQITDTRDICEQQKASYEAEKAAQNIAARDEYKAQCVTVSYSDVERNPDSYEGKAIAIYGTVEQVQEGWFDTVTLRINSDGDMWYITYTHKEGESRILEGDYISCYGECDGVTSYTSVLGTQVTIPALKMEYYE